MALPDWSEITDSGPNTTRHVVTGLTNRIEYTFEVRAKAGMVHGDPARATATPRPTVTPPPTPCQTLRIDPISNVTVNVNESFSRTASATGGCDPIRITMRGEPSGVTIPSGTGRSKTIRGPATVTGEYEVTVTATDSRGNAANKNFTITVRRPSPPICATITIHEIDDVTVTVGRSISIDASATGGCGSITFSMTGAPTGVTIGPDNGRIRGDAPSTPGTHRVTVTATDEEENTDDEPFTIVVPCRRVRIADIADMTVTAEARFSHTASVSGGCGSRTSSRERGPTWVRTEIDANGNLRISGTAPPTPGGPYDVSVMVQDAYGNADEELFTISVETGLTVSCPENQVVTTGERIDAHATAAGGQPPYRFREPSIEPSTGLGLSITTNGSNGSISGTAGSVGDYRVTVTVNDDDDDSATCRFNVTVTARPCAVDVGGLSDVTATKGSEIPSMTASASRGESPYTYTMSGAPGTVEIDDESGVISGKVGSTAGEFDVTVTATDDFECPGTASFKITVECPPITVTQNPDPVVVPAGETATVTVSAEGGCGTKTFGNPGGLGWVRKTGSNEYTVEPPSGTAPGPYTFGVTATDAEGNTGPGSINVTVTCPTITVGGLDNVKVEVDENMPSMTARASGGQSPYTFRKEIGPEWVNVSTAGVISGRAPNTTGEYTVRVKATDAGGCWGTTTFEIRVVNPPLEIADIRDVEATVGQEMPARAASASGGETPYVFTMSGKPSWVDFNRSSGRISGTPTSTGTSTATVTVTDKKGVTATTPSFQLRVSAPLTIASISDVVVTWQLDMNPIQVSASGGRGSYTYDLESEPAGISITSSGRIGGTPTQLGSATVTVVVDDEDDRRVTTSFRMTVALPGDFNGDGRRNAADAKLFNKKMGLGRSDAGFDRRMDLNGDGTINYADFVILTGYIESDAAAQSGQ